MNRWGVAAGGLLLSCSTLDLSALGSGSPDAGVVLDDAAFRRDRTRPMDAGRLPEDAGSGGGSAVEGYGAGECDGVEAALRDRDCNGEPDGCLTRGACGGSNLVGQYLFEGDLLDASGSGNGATAFENVRYVPGAVGTALALELDTRVEIARSASLDFVGEVSVEMWVEARELPAAGRMGLLDDDGRFGLFVMSEGQISCTVADVGTAVGGSLEPGVPSHVACVAARRLVRVLQNGRVVGEAQGGEALAALAVGPLVLGGNAPAGDRFQGWMDTLRIWSTALEQEHFLRAAATGSPE